MKPDLDTADRASKVTLANDTRIQSQFGSKKPKPNESAKPRKALCVRPEADSGEIPDDGLYERGDGLGTNPATRVSPAVTIAAVERRRHPWSRFQQDQGQQEDQVLLRGQGEPEKQPRPEV